MNYRRRISNLWYIAVIVLLLALIALYANSLQTPQAKASANPGMRTLVATTSNPAVSATAALVFASSTCTARIITTYASPIMITFSDSAGVGGGPTGTFGHLQAASTSILYDAGQYGCDAVRIYSFASQNITVSEERDAR